MKTNLLQAVEPTYILGLLFAVLIGLTIVKIVDFRLTDISINMPTIHIPDPGLIARPDPVNSTVKPLKSKKVEFNSLSTLRQRGGSNIEGSNTKTGHQFDKNMFHSNSKKLSKSEHEKIIKPTPPASTNHRAQPGSIERPDVEIVKVGGLLNKETGDTYYLDPKDMSQAQIAIFAHAGDVNKMTLKDYENWLHLFVQNPERLIPAHRANLRILLRGGQLIENDIPRHPEKADSKQEYTQEISQTGEILLKPQPDFLGYQPYNFEELGDWGKVNNHNMRHLEFVNPDEPLKTWELGRKVSR